MSDNKRFEYLYTTVNDIGVNTVEDQKTGKKVVKTINLQGRILKPTDRFWNSLFARFGFNSSIFKFFDHLEVFSRISEKEENDRMRICIETDKDDGTESLLAVSSPTKPVVEHKSLIDMLDAYKGEGVTYHNGVVESVHVPRSNGGQFQIGGDDFANRFVMSTPIDGYGLPSIYLSLLRYVCSNGMIGYSKAFKSQLALGKGADNIEFSITRALDGFGNDEGFAALRQRFEAATQSWASVHEATTLYKMIVRGYAKKQMLDGGVAVPKGTRIEDILLRPQAAAPGGFEVKAMTDMGQEIAEHSPILKAYHRMTGDASQLYGLANLDALSVKRQRALPVKAKVYDLLNFASEVATHYSSEAFARTSQAWIGELISNEYDMEGNSQEFGSFDDFYVDRKLAHGKELQDAGAK